MVIGPRRKRPLGPAWFDLERYACAAELDAGEWLLNLLFRCWIGRTGDPFGASVVQGPRPVLRRGDAEQIEWLERRFLLREGDAPGGLLRLLRGEPPRSGIRPLTVRDHYEFQGRLPEELQERGSRYAQDDRSPQNTPPAFLGRFDHAFNPPFLGRFVRIDLALPDRALLSDLASFLQSERAELARLGGDQPYRAAVRTANKKRPRLRTLATYGLLPYLDLQSWALSCSPVPSDYQLAALIGTASNNMARVRELADRCQHDLVIRAWLEPAARGIPSKSKRGK
jgi:hypothetical protein